MADDARPGPLALVHQGWEHLRLGRPLAARACWWQAARVGPDDSAAARKALDGMDDAPDLPIVARKDAALKLPRDPARLACVQERVGDTPGGDLFRDAATFAELADEFPDDPHLNYSAAILRAWQGRNREAIERLGRYVGLVAATDPDEAANAWMIAEVLRAGAGAETLADDLSFAANVPLGVVDDDPSEVLVGLHPVRLGPDAPVDDVRVFEWYDRPMPDPSDDLTADHLPQVLANVVVKPGLLRISSPDPSSLDLAVERLGPWRERAERTATPLPLPLLDAGLWTFRLPPGLDDDTRLRLTREALEHRYEDAWIHWPRHGLDGLTPLAAGQSDDPILKAKLEAVIKFREQLGARPRSSLMYVGYPFDRLRRRLGLPPADPGTVDPNDWTCAGLSELEVLDPTRLAPAELADAATSAVGLRDDALTARLASELASRPYRPFGGRWPDLIAGIVRHALDRGDVAGALAWLDRASTIDQNHRDDFDIWRAEVAVQSGDPEVALATYISAFDRKPDAGRALVGAENLAEYGYPDHAHTLAERARDIARNPAERAAAEGLLSTLRDGLTG